MRSFLFLLTVCFTLPVLALSEESIDRLVEKAPEVKSGSDLGTLMEKITQDLKTDEEKAYAALAWLVRNIDYDDYKAEQIKKISQFHYTRAKVPQSEDILKTRLGVSEDIANLYANMLKKINMKVKVIDGCNKPIDVWKKTCNGEILFWNAVWIDNKWELVDPTLAITGGKVVAMEDVSFQRQYDRELEKRQKTTSKVYDNRKNRRVDKKWFMTLPEIMQKDHHPLEEKWYLMKSQDRKNQNL